MKMFGLSEIWFSWYYWMTFDLEMAILFFSFLFIFNWRIIALQYCVGFCHTSMCISHGYTYVHFLFLFLFRLVVLGLCCSTWASLAAACQFSWPQTCGILVCWPGIQLASSAFQGRFLTTGPRWKSFLIYTFKWHKHEPVSSFTSPSSIFFAWWNLMAHQNHHDSYWYVWLEMAVDGWKPPFCYLQYQATETRGDFRT